MPASRAWTPPTRALGGYVCERCADGFKGVDTTNQGSLEDFVDAGKVSNFAKEAMTWAVATELIIGVGDEKLEPKATSNRGQIATVIERFETVNLA